MLQTNWEWEDPTILLALATLIVTAVIPLFIWRLGVKQTKRDSETNRRQTDTLDRLERLELGKRRDVIVRTLNDVSDRRHLALLWIEIEAFGGDDRKFLRAVYRANPNVPFPSGRGSPREDVLDGDALRDYMAGMDRRYSRAETGFYPYPGLMDFLKASKFKGLQIDEGKLAELVTGPTSAIQKPPHEFYRNLVHEVPESAAPILYRVRSIDYRNEGGTRLNVLTGVVLAIVDVEMRRDEISPAVLDRNAAVLRKSIPQALATVLVYGGLRGMKDWSTKGATEPVSATVAWIIRLVGWVADVDNHLSMRMIENLADAILQIPNKDRGWGIDDKHVRQGFKWIAKKQPSLWQMYGSDLEAAADEIGRWRKRD